MKVPHANVCYGLLGEFDTPKELMAAARKVREAGYRHIDAYAPFPMEGLSQALGLGRKHDLVPLIALIGGLGGGLSGFFFQLWVNASSYPMNIGGRPLNSWPAFIPVTFELTVLGASLFAVFGMLAMNKLPQPHHPLFNVERFKHASSDKFFLCIEADDPKFHPEGTARFLASVNAQHVTEVRDED
jgi:Alternative complex III, ActD subunit